jgi:uncharacterized protein (UPF0216 family)
VYPVNLFYPNNNNNMAEFLREKSPEVYVKHSSTLDNYLAEKDLSVPQLSETNEAVKKLTEEPVINSETLSKGAASINTEVESKSTDVPFVVLL